MVFSFNKLSSRIDDLVNQPLQHIFLTSVLSFQVSAFLTHYFTEITDYSFTADMETEVGN